MNVHQLADEQKKEMQDEKQLTNLEQITQGLA